VKRRQAVEAAKKNHAVSERYACRAIGQPRATHRYKIKRLPDEKPLTSRIIELATRYGRYGYRRINALLRREGWPVNHKRVERIWRQQGLKVPQKQPKRRRLWLNDGSCIRLRPEKQNHVWSYDFVVDRTNNGRAFRILNIIDEYTRESLLTKAARNMKAEDVEECLTELFCQKGVPEYIRSDNGSEFTAERIRNWLSNLGVTTMFIEPGSPWKTAILSRLTARCGMNF